MKISNPRVFHDFNILETIEAGINLTGPEVKSIRCGRMSLDGSFIKIIGSETYLVNAQIFLYPYARSEGYDAKRTRKLLLHKKEIIALKTKLAQGRLTVVPLECYNSHGVLKLKIGIARGKREYEKREKLRRRDIDREVQRELRGKIN